MLSDRSVDQILIVVSKDTNKLNRFTKKTAIKYQTLIIFAMNKALFDKQP